MGVSDAIAQHYPIMCHIRDMWIDFFDALASGRHYTFPMVDFAVGMGENTISALNYYGLGDPFYVLTVLASEETLPHFYTLFFFFRIYLGGLAFIAFSSELSASRGKAAYIAGAFVYCFTGFTLLSNAHIIFVHAMFYIPLMLLGAEKSVNGKKKGLLCIATAGFALSGFYFLYIGSVSLAVYVIYRLVVTQHTLRLAIVRIRGLVMEYFLGLGLSAVIFLPAVTGFFSSNRSKNNITFDLIMPLSEQIHMVKNMFFPSYEPIQTLAVSTIGMIVVICALVSRNRKKEKIILLLLYLSAVIPFITYAMSGFGALYDRWELVIDMYIAFLVVDMFDELIRTSIVQKASAGAVFCILFVLGKKQDLFDSIQFKETFRSYGIILLVLCAILPLLRRLKKEMVVKCILSLTILCTVIGNWRKAVTDRPIESLRERDAVAELVGSVGQAEAFYRIENERSFAEPRLQMNISLLRGYPGIMQYVSVSNPIYLECFPNWDIASGGFNVYGLDQRSVLETMCAVRYFVVRTEYASIVPYGFEYVKATEDGEWALYENANALPIAYAYDNICDIKSYKEMNGLEKQSMMLHAAAVEGYEGEIARLDSFYDDLTEGEYTILSGSNPEIEGETSVQVESGSTIVLTTQLRRECENCLLYTGSELFYADFEIEDGYSKYGISKTPVVMNLGTSHTDRSVDIKITFSGNFTFNKEDFHIIYHDLSKYGQYVDRLKQGTEGRFEVSTNKIHGETDFESSKLLCFSVPYAQGWHAAIDGKETRTYVVNDLFTGIEVPQGYHDIELYYITPGIRVGAGISVVSLIIVIIFGLYKKKMKN